MQQAKEGSLKLLLYKVVCRLVKQGFYLLSSSVIWGSKWLEVLLRLANDRKKKKKKKKKKHKQQQLEQGHSAKKEGKTGPFNEAGGQSRTTHLNIEWLRGWCHKQEQTWEHFPGIW